MIKFLNPYVCLLVCFLSIPCAGQRKTIMPDQTTFHIEEGEFSFEFFANESQYQKLSPYQSDRNTETFETHNNRLPRMMHRALEKEKLNDTTDIIFPNYKSNLKMDLEVQRFETKIINYYNELKIIVYYRFELTLKSHFGKSLSSQKYTSSFSFFLENDEDLFDEIFNEFEYEIGGKIRKFIELEEVKPLIELNHESDPAFELSNDTILLKNQDIQKIEDWNRALVTIIDSLGHGSGAIISSDGYVVTNYHVVAQSNKLHVKLYNNRSFAATIIRYDPETDLALLKIDTTQLNTFPIWKTTSNLIGNEIFVAGTPVDTLLSNSISYGIVSGQRAYHGIEYLQTDAIINFGNSGGPMLSAEGQIVGIVNAKFGGFGIEGIGFAIPANYMIERLKLRQPAVSSAKTPSPLNQKRSK
jgi:serine protease Do